MVTIFYKQPYTEKHGDNSALHIYSWTTLKTHPLWVLRNLQKLPDGSALKPDSATLRESLIASRFVSSALHLLSQFSHKSTAETKHKLIVLRNLCSAIWLSSFWIHHYAVNNLWWRQTCLHTTMIICSHVMLCNVGSLCAYSAGMRSSGFNLRAPSRLPPLLEPPASVLPLLSAFSACCYPPIFLNLQNENTTIMANISKPLSCCNSHLLTTLLNSCQYRMLY